MIFNPYALDEFLRCKVLTRAELASRADISRGYVSDLLSATKKNPTRTIVRRIARALDVDPRALYIDFPDEIARVVTRMLAERAA